MTSGHPTYTLSQWLQVKRDEVGPCTAASKTPPLSKPPLTLVNDLGLTCGITEGVAENF